MEKQRKRIIWGIISAVFVLGIIVFNWSGKQEIVTTKEQVDNTVTKPVVSKKKTKSAIQAEQVALRKKQNIGKISTEYVEKVEKEELEIIQAEALTTLEHYEGEYDETSIVLEGITKERAEEIAAELGAKLRITNDELYAQLTLPKGVTISDVVANDEYLSYVQEMSPDWIVYPVDVNTQADEAESSVVQSNEAEISEEESSEEESSEETGMASDLTVETISQFNDPLFDKQTYYDYMNVGDVLSETYDKKVKVAIIDSGIDIDHPEFEGIISDRSYNASTDQVVADYGMEVIQDGMGHGTVCAGVLAAAYNNNEGIVGAANNVELVVIKCETNPDRTFKRASDINFGLAYAIEQNVDVVSMSIGSGGSVNPYKTYCQLAVDSDITVIAAAGNDMTSAPSWPAADPNVIGVGALEYDSWDLAWYSNFGDNSDILAPGQVLTTNDGGNYTMVHGTSLATPIVAGIVSRFYATHTEVTYAMVKELLEASAIDLGDPGEDWIYGFGAMNVDTFINGEIGTITFDYLTDEIDNSQQLFYRNHILQRFPEPERENVVFAGWFMDEQCTEPFDNLTTPLTEDITLYAAWENEDEGVPFDYVEVEGGIEITKYRGKRRYAVVPPEIDGKTVVGIGSQAFEGNHDLLQVDLPDTLKYIGYLSFSNCSKLSRMIIPDSVVRIDNGAFAGCSFLTVVDISENTLMESIGESAFEQCASLREFYIGKYVNNVSGNAFAGTVNMQSLTLHEENPNYILKDETLYSSDYLWAIYRPAKINTDIEIDARTKYIGVCAFNCSRASKVNIPEGVEWIGYEAFSFSLVEEVKLPSTVYSIGMACFQYCEHLSSFDFGNSTIAVIDKKTFRNCSGLSSICIPNSVTIIAEEAFSGCGLMDITWEDNCQVNKIDTRAFNINPFSSFSIPASIEVMGNFTFELCWNLKDVTFENGSKLTSIYPGVFWCCYSLEQIDLPDSIEVLYNTAFAYSGLKSIELPRALHTIEEAVFQECNDFAEITVDKNNEYFIEEENVLYNKAKTVLVLYPCARVGESFDVPEGITGIAEYAFYGARNIKAISLPNTITMLDGYAFSHCYSMETINLPEELVTIGLNVFEYCIELKEFDLPAKVKTIGRYAFYCCMKMESIRVVHDAQLSRIGYAAFAYTGIKTFSVPATVSGMGQLVFAGCSELQTVRFEDGSRVNSISAWMFDGADSLKEVAFGVDSDLQYVSARAFERLKSLEDIDLSNCTKLEKIGNYAFSACTRLKEVHLPEGIVEIGRYAFHNCRSLSMLTIPSTVNEIGAYAFAYTDEIELFFEGTELPKILATNWNYGVKSYYLGAKDKTISGDWIYVLHSDGTISICGYKGNDVNIDLAEIDGHKVSSIGYAAFKNSRIESIALYEGLTSIGDSAFAGTDKLKSIHIPADCKYIGTSAFEKSALVELTFAENSELIRIADSAFANTPELGEIILPAALEIIGRNAFAKSGIDSVTFEEGAILDTIERFVFAESELESITLPDLLKKIDYHAFYKTSKLEAIDFGNPEELSIRGNAFYGSGIGSVNIPKGVTYIGEFAFDSCVNMTEITVDEENAWYSSKEGVLYNKNKTKLITYPSGRVEGVVIPSTVLSIMFGAFENAKVTSVTFEEGSNLATIGYRAFYQCSNLTSVQVPESLLSFDAYAFAECTALETVDITVAENLSGIYNGAFYGCEKLSEFVIPDTVREIGDYVFYDCKSAVSAIGENSKLISIGDYAFAHAGITEFIAGEDLLGIGYAAFQDSALTNFDLSQAPLTYIGSYAFEGVTANVDTLVIADTVAEIGYLAFGGIHSIKDLTLPIPQVTDDNQPFTADYLFGDSTENNIVEVLTITSGYAIANRAFVNIHTLKELYLPEELEVIGEAAFAMADLLEINLPNNLKILGNNAFEGNGDIASVVLPDSLTSIGQRCFLGCDNLSGTFIIPKNVSYIGEWFIGNAMVDAVVVDEENPNFSSIDGILYDAKVTELIFCPRNYTGEVVVPDSVKYINSFSFDGCMGVTALKLPASLASINANALSRSGIKELTIPGGIETLGDRILEGSLVETVIFEEGVQRIPYYVLGHCGTLKKVVIPSTVTSIDELAFCDCSALEEIVIAEGVECIGNQAFVECRSLKELVIPSTVKELGNGIVGRCIALEKLAIHEDNPYYKMVDGMILDTAGTHVYASMPSYTGTYVIPNGVEIIGSHAFFGGKLTGVVIPDSVKVLEERAFGMATDLKDIQLGDGIEYLGPCLFDYEATLPYRDEDGMVYIDNYLTDGGGNNKEKCVIKEGTRGIANCAFEYHDKLSRVVFPDSLKFIGNNAFAYTTIESLYLPASLEYIYPDAFYEVTELKEVVFAEGFHADMWVEEYGAWFGSGPFDGNKNIETIVIPQSMRVQNADPDVLSLSVEALGELGYYFDWNTYRFYWQDGVRIIIRDSEEPAADIDVALVNGADIYTYEEKLATLWHNGWDEGNSVYYGDEWNLATYEVDNCIVKIDTMKKGSVMQPPAETLVKEELTDTCNFTWYGWDIDEDNEADVLPTTLLEDITAKAVYSVHDWTNPVTTEATCTLDGKTVYTCALCNASKKEIIESLGHDYEVVSIVDPTEEEDGYTVYECSVCQDSYHADYVLAEGDTLSDWQIVKDATCTEPGQEGRYSVLGGHLIETRTIEPKGHAEGDWIIVEHAECEVDGLKIKRCTVCAEKLVQEIIVAPGHTYSDWLIIKEATTEYAGERSRTCEVCEYIQYDTIPQIEKIEASDVQFKDSIKTMYVGEIKTLEVVFDPIDVTETNITWTSSNEDIAIVDAYGAITAKAPGEVTITATTDNEISVSCSITVEPAICIHNMKHISRIEASCLEDGNIAYYICDNCDLYFEDKEGTKEISVDGIIIPAIGHTEVVDEKIEASCTKEGLTEGKHCAECDTIIVKQEVIEALGHDYSEWETIKSPSCEDAGSKQRICKVCKHTETEGVEATGHKWETEYRVDKSASCTEDGSKSIHCVNCEVIKDSTVIPATGHTEVVDEKVEASCTEEGLTEGKHCAECDTIIVKQEVIEVLDHDYSEWETIKSPSCEDVGSKQRICNVCKHTETEGVEATGHKWETEYRVDKSASCTEDGSKSIHCVNCEAIKDSVVIGRMPHIWSIDTVTIKPTATKDGQKISTCIGCNATKTEAISATGAPIVGTVIVDKKNGMKYKVTKSGLTDGTVEIIKGNSSKKQIIITDIVTFEGIVYKVTSIASKAFNGNKKLTKVTIGKNISKIGKDAFRNCTKLKTVTIKSTSLKNKSIGKNAFKNIHTKAKIKVPAKKLNEYKKFLKNSGVTGKKQKIFK